MRARRLRGLHLAAGQGAHLEDALEARRWLAIRFPRRARLPSCSAGASTGDGGRPARFIRCIHNCDLARNWIVSVVGLDFKPVPKVISRGGYRVAQRLVSQKTLRFVPVESRSVRWIQGKSRRVSKAETLRYLPVLRAYCKPACVSLTPQPPPVVTPPQGALAEAPVPVEK